MPHSDSSVDIDNTDDGPTRGELRTKRVHDEARQAVLESDSDNDVQPGQERLLREDWTSDSSDKSDDEVGVKVGGNDFHDLEPMNFGNQIDIAPLAPQENLNDPAVPAPVELAASVCPLN